VVVSNVNAAVAVDLGVLAAEVGVANNTQTTVARIKGTRDSYEAEGIKDVEYANSIDNNSKSCFKLINVQQGNPVHFNGSCRTWIGESSTKRKDGSANHAIANGYGSRLVTPSLSNTINDSNISNCNRRLRSVDDELEELRLWKIAKEIGMVCQDCEDSILQ